MATSISTPCCSRSPPTPTRRPSSRLPQEDPMADEPQAQPQAAAGAAAGEGNLLDQIISKGKLARDDSQKPRAKDLVKEFVDQIVDAGMTVSRDTITMIQTQIARIDDMISSQLDEIL